MRFVSAVRRFMCELWGLPGPDARVDPTAFPEAEYPVYCMRCGYELRGLAESRCPECGDPFDRGHLLLEQYIHCKRQRPDRRYRLANTFGWVASAAICAIVVVVGGPALTLMLWGDALMDSAMRVDYIRHLPRILLILHGIVLVAIVGNTVLGFITPPPWAKCRAVREAWQAERRKARTRKRADGTPDASPPA